MASRNPNGASSVYLGADGSWHGRVTVGFTDDGSQDRRHVRGKSKSVVVAKVKGLERLRDRGAVARVGQRWTVADWLDHWLNVIAKPSLRLSSFQAYQTAVTKHLVPGIGKHKLERLQVEHLEVLYRRMTDAGAAAGTAHQVHRTIRTALGEAVRRGHVGRNVAALARPPRVRPEPVVPLTLEEVRLILRAAEGEPNGARWAVALALGLRQGEVLGLHWDDVDLERGSLRVRSSRLRPSYVHGCSSPCGKFAGWCPQRRQVTADRGATKSDAGRRIVGLPKELTEILAAHRVQQLADRQHARQLWVEGGWVFASPTGAAINPNTDYHRWRALLRKAGVRDARLHDARHTAATVLLVLGVPERAVMGIMGWSSTSMAARYQHVTDQIRGAVAEKVGAAIWGSGDGSDEGN